MDRAGPSLLTSARPDATQTAAAHAPLEGAAINLLFCCGPDYFQHLAVALVSLCENNSNNTLRIHLISSRPDAQAEAKLRRSIAPFANAGLHVRYFSWDQRERWFTSYHIRDEAYTRLMASSVLDASIDKIIYMDSDLVVTGDLAALWATDVRAFALAAVPDPFGAWRGAQLGMPPGAAYVNSGVMVLNLARWRAQQLSERLGAYIAREGGRLLFHDQDAVNAVLHDQTKVVDYRWNVQAATFMRARVARLPERASLLAAALAPAVVHYTSARKPWLFTSATPRKDLYWKYLLKTEWRGARAAGRGWRAAPEYVVNHGFHLLGSAYTWDRMLRSTRAGRALDRCMRALRLRRAG